MNFYHFVPSTSLDFFDWLHFQDYKDKQTLKLYIIPMIKYYTAKYKDVVQKYIIDYMHLHSEFRELGTEKVVIEYIKKLSKK